MRLTASEQLRLQAFLQSIASQAVEAADKDPNDASDSGGRDAIESLLDDIETDLERAKTLLQKTYFGTS